MADETNEAAAAAAAAAAGGAPGDNATAAEAAKVAEPPKAAERAPRAKAAAKADVAMVEAVVLRGTIMVGDHGEEEAVGPGGKVTLPADQVAALRKRGVLVDPEAAPTFNAGPVSDIDGGGPKVTAG